MAVDVGTRDMRDCEDLTVVTCSPMIVKKALGNKVLGTDPRKHGGNRGQQETRWQIRDRPFLPAQQTAVLGRLTRFGLETRSVTTALVGWALKAPHGNISR